MTEEEKEAAAQAANKAAADAVQAKIDAIGTVTLQSGWTIELARAYYNALTDVQKELVDISKLEAAEEAYLRLVLESGEFENTVNAELLLSSPIGEFEVGNNDFVATSVVNGHDYLYVPHNASMFVYDLDTGKKVDEEYVGMTESDGIYVDSQGIVWMFGQSAYLYRYDPKTGEGRRTASDTLTNGSSVGCFLFGPLELNGKLYLGRRKDAHLVEYDPATDTFTDLGALIENGERITTLVYKDGYLYASAHAASASQDPHILVKYDLAAKKVVATLNLNDPSADVIETNYLTQTVIVGDILFGTSTKQSKMLAVDINTMQLVDVGCEVGAVHGFSQVIKEEGNEKIYFMRRDSSTAYTFCEYNSSTKTVTPVEGFEKTTNQFNTIGSSFVTLEESGQERQYLLVGMEKDGTVVLYDLANKQVKKIVGLTEGDGTPNNIICFNPGLEGSNELYIGCFMSNICGVYDITTNTMTKLYTGYSEQIETTGWYDGKWYVSGYGACSVSEMDYDTGKYKVLFALNEADKLNFTQERIHNITAGEGKVFAATVPHKGILGGFVAWYDYEKATTFVAVEEDKVVYQKDSDKSGWYDVKTNEKVVFNTEDGGANDFEGFIANQVVYSLFYIDGYLYGTTYIGGGSSSTPKEDSSAKLFVYDVENMEMVTIYDINDGIEGLAWPVTRINAFAPDPEVEGKFWGMVAQTLFTATFDKETKTFQIEEIVSYGKDSFRQIAAPYKNGQMYFDDGYIIALFRSDDPNSLGSDASVYNLRMISMEDPSYNVCLSTETFGFYVLSDDGNVYIERNDGIYVLRTADLIDAVKENKAAADAVDAKIDAIGTVTLKSEAAIKEARAAYDALTDDQKVLVSNLTTLTAAEAALEALQENPKTGDMTAVAGMSCVMFMSLLALSAVLVSDIKRKRG